ncbi:MAG TPA: SAM-dependent chlorinase/fluorinase [Candidatus Methylomirabilis sp.]|nr:SAM-dependent chlorinase/fluorinase [Candidatus Methylomirabilis sp.]
MGDDARRVITLLTDFGGSDPFVGMMKGVILGINPEAVIVDLCHGTTAHDPSEAAFLLATSYRYFPNGTIHVAVVDPGVGGPRRPILAASDGHLFVGPDNGLLGPIAERGGPSSVRTITAERYFLLPVSATFHGRDIFAPVAGHLSLGAEPDRFGPPIDDYVRLMLPRPSPSGVGSIKGEVLRIDRFGNLVSNIARDDLERVTSGGPIMALRVKIAGRTVPIVAYYAQVAPGTPGAVIGSADYLEIFVHQGDASRLLRAGRGAELVVSSEKVESGS